MENVRQERREDRRVVAMAAIDNGAPLTRLPRAVCIDCGGKIAEVLARLGSTRCHDCRESVRTAAALGPT